MFCINRKLLILVFGISAILYTIIAFNDSISWKSTSYKAKAQTDNYCESMGLYNVPGPNEGVDSDLKKQYEAKCVGNTKKPQWNGKRRGNGAGCYTATAVCGKIPGCIDKNCLARISNDIPCINEPVDIEKCKDAGVVTEAQLAENQCFYGGIELSEYSTPYSYDPENFCVRETIGTKTKYIGYRCQNKDNKLTGGLMASAVKDVGCSLDTVTLTTTPVPPTSPLFPNEPTDMPVISTSTPAQPSRCNESKFIELNFNCIEGWYVGRCGKADSTSYWRCGCDPDRPSFSYPMLYKKSSCP